MTGPADEAYLVHHFSCRVCINGGQGRGERCGVGAPLWAAYLVEAEALPLQVTRSITEFGKVDRKEKP